MTQEEFPETQELIIGTRTMPRADWVRARAFAYMTSLLHFDKLLQVPLVLCHEVGRIPAERRSARRGRDTRSSSSCSSRPISIPPASRA